MARLVEQATSRQSPAEAAVARFAKVYTPLVVVACLLLAFLPWVDPDANRRVRARAAVPSSMSCSYAG
jgi:cation transport ATPase